MTKHLIILIPLVAAMCFHNLQAQENSAQNPVIFADVPDMSMIRVGETYYMSSTTMHLSPGLPIMRSEDLVNWEIISYAYNTLADVDALNLANGKEAYGQGSWASSLRYHKGTYYVSTFASTTGRTYIYSTQDPENGPWRERSFEPSLHDSSLIFEEDGGIFMIYGGGELKIVELEEDLSGIKAGTEKVLIENASEPAGNEIGLPAEGSQLFKVNNKYYLFTITWPRDGMRTVLIHRADNLMGPYEGRLALQDKGVAQGGLIDTPTGEWYAYLFRDYGAVGRIPYLVPVTWENDWPVLGINGEVPETLEGLPGSRGLIPGIVAPDDFEREENEPLLPPVWQWNHNPVDNLWSLTDRKGFLRLTTGRTDSSFVSTRNSLTQRTIGPASSGSTALDVTNMKEGDIAGLGLLQKKYGYVGIRFEDGKKSVVMVNNADEDPVEVIDLPAGTAVIHLKAEADFRNRTDAANFFYSLDGTYWKPVGNTLKMEYTLPHFMGYRFALFNFATETTGGFVEFDYFDITEKISEKK